MTEEYRVLGLSSVRRWAVGHKLLTLRPVERWCTLIGIGLIGAGLAHVVPALMYPRPWAGPLSWRKPITFGLSFGLVLLSVTWVSSYLRLPDRVRAVALAVFAADSVVEVTGIAVQAWRHVPSHLNTTSPFDAAIAFTLAAGGAVLIVTLGLLAVPALRGQIDAAPSMRLALRAGFAFLLTGLAAGIAMIARGEVLIHTVSRHVAYDEAGFLKLFHGVTLHAVLVLPAIAWLAERSHWDESRRRRIVQMGVRGYLLAAVVTLVIGIVRV